MRRVCVSCVGVCVVLPMFYTIHIFFFVMRVYILYMYNYSVCCGVTSVGAIDMKLVRNGEKVGNCARYFAIKRVTKSDKSATKSIQKNVAKNLLPGVNGHLLPGVNGHLLPGVNGHLLPGVNRHLLPGVNFTPEPGE